VRTAKLSGATLSGLRPEPCQRCAINVVLLTELKNRRSDHGTDDIVEGLMYKGSAWLNF